MKGLLINLTKVKGELLAAERSSLQVSYTI